MDNDVFAKDTELQKQIFYNTVRGYLGNPSDEYTRYEYIDVEGYRVTIGVNKFGISGPGGATILWRYLDTLIMAVDFLHDYPDRVLIGVRARFAAVLDELGVKFIPVSISALNRTTLSRGLAVDVVGIDLVDRVNMECVYSISFTFGMRYYISGFDRNEDPPLYFLARLPHAVGSYTEAIEALKPSSVKIAEREGLTVLRQGDMFAIPTEYNKQHLIRMNAVIYDMNTTSLYGTAHHATETAHLPDGTMFGRGVIFHRPLGRNPDHASLALTGAEWYLVVKNAVPVQEMEVL